MTMKKTSKQTTAAALQQSIPFKTRDIFIASALKAAGRVLLEIERDDQRRAWFVFEDVLLCQAQEAAYWKRQLPVDAKTLADAHRELKDRIFGGPAHGR